VPAYALLDRDGTLVADRPDGEWRGVTDVPLLPGVASALTALADLGYTLVVVTNQYLIDEGFIAEQDYARTTRSLVAQLEQHGVRLAAVQHCPHARWVACPCRKPGTAMVDAVVRRLGPMDRERSFVVGDSACDTALAERLGVRGFRIGKVDEHGGTPLSSLADLPAALRSSGQSRNVG